MHDLKWIRENPDVFDAALKRRGVEALSARILEMDAERRGAQTALQEHQTRRNEASKLIGKAMGSGDEETANALKAEVSELKDKLKADEDREREVGNALDDLLAGIPNLPADDVPDGDDEDAKVEIR